jgi:hypothetical protein
MPNIATPNCRYPRDLRGHGRNDIARHWKQVQPFDANTAFVWE